jgi:hypothetical protein
MYTETEEAVRTSPITFANFKVTVKLLQNRQEL